jgi:hypothetical protein
LVISRQDIVLALFFALADLSGVLISKMLFS